MKKVSVQCRHVRLSYGSTDVLRDVDLDIAPGEFFALLGPSGSGKSTLLRLIAGFARQQRGQVLIDGIDVSARAPWERDVGMVFQSYALWPHLSVWDNVAFGLVERKVDRATLRQKVGATLELVGLGAHGDRRPNQLSGGQQQRVALARTLVVEPKVLLLDEPLSNLDKTLRVQMRQELLSLQRRLGLTTVFVTHDQEEAMSTADRMAVLDQGVVQQVGTPTALYDAPVNPFVAGFVGTMNLLPGRVAACDAQALMLDIDGLGPLPLALASPVAAGGRVLLSLRPHALHLVADGSTWPAGPGPDEGLAWLPGTIESSEFVGAFTRYQVRVGPHALAVDQAHRLGAGVLAPGCTVRVGLAADQVRLFAR